MILFVQTTQFNFMKSSESEISLEFERKKSLLILLQLKLTNKTGRSI